VVGLNEKRGYHLEFVCGDINEARALCDELAAHDVFAKAITADKTTRVYIKDSESICNLLALVGANKPLLELHDKIAMRSVRNTSNRRANCDTGNINRQVTAAAKQIEAIKNLENIPPDLAQTARARLENPDATYEELAEILGITKSGVVHRLRKLTSG